jgi:hypothetical protein
VKRILAFAVASAVLIAIVATLSTLAFPGEERQRAIITSAGIAFMTQGIGFVIMYLMAPTNVMVGWGAGMLARIITLGVHGFLGARILGLPLDASLLSLAAFFFVTSLIEPLFLPQPALPARATR